MKGILICMLIVFTCHLSFSQDMTKFKLYKPEEKAGQEIANAVKQAKTEGKHVFIQIGGNWCIWCARFNDFITTDKSIDSLIRANYIVYHMNWSKENYNPELMAKYGFPQRFGFPVFLILDGEGKLIHTQDSEYLEDGKTSYVREKVIGFFNNWTPKALDPKKYIQQ